MAARDDIISFTDDTWTQLTNGAATGNVTVSVLSGAGYLRATGTASAPGASELGLMMRPGDSWKQATIAEVFPGVSSAQHLYWRGKAEVFISHG